jgi:hypothetical protein
VKTRKTIPTLLFAVLLSLTLSGCDSGSSAGNGAVSQPTNSTASSPPPSGSAATSPSTAGGSNSTANSTSTGAGSGGDVKLTVVKYVITADSNPGISTHYLGIVKNEGNSTVTQLTVQVVDDSGQVQGAASALEYAILPPGQSAGFNLEYVGPDIKRPQFKATGTAIASDGLQPAQLSIVSSQFATSASGGQAVEGVVKNDSDHRAALWGVNVIFYDDSGKIVDVNSGSGHDAAGAALPLEAHSTVKFHVDVTGIFADTSSISGVKATRYDLFASGYQHP